MKPEEGIELSKKTVGKVDDAFIVRKRHIGESISLAEAILFESE